ncbi:hypothetical protein JCM3774_002347 [Rhodotorula dairenensis]
MTASPMAEAVPSPLAESSFNLQPVASPRPYAGTPGERCAPQGKDVRFVLTPDRRSDSPLAPQNTNSPGASLLLIDVEASESRDCTPKTLPIRPPSAFARSLLDRTPGMFKAHLGTPLIPLGTPVTTRKRAQRTPSSAAAADQENGTPSVRRSARLASPCPVGPSPRVQPHGPDDSPASPARVSMRFSPTPRKFHDTPGKTTPAKSAQPRSASSTSKGSPVSASPASASPASTSPVEPSPAVKLSSGTPLQTALTASSLVQSPFPAFSPSTPLIRTHDSYSDTELTDCDADGSVWEDEYEDPSFSYLANSNDPQVVDDALDRLQLDETSEAEASCSTVGVASQELLASVREESVLLTATEVESASDSDADDEPSLELDPIAEHDAASDATSSTSASDLECGPEHATACSEAAPFEESTPAERTVAEAFEAVPSDAQRETTDEEAPVAEDEPDSRLEDSDEGVVVDFPNPETFTAGSALPPAGLAEIPLQVALAPEAEDAQPCHETISSSDGVPTVRSASPSANPIPGEIVQSDFHAEREGDHDDEEPAQTVAHEAGDTASVTLEVTPVGSGSAPSSAEPDAEESAGSEATPTRTTVVSESTTPVVTPPAATPPRRPLTSVVPAAQQPLGKAAPTARRQLTKLTSVAATAQRSAVPGKSSLTTLVPASAVAAARRVPTTSRLAVPVRAEATSGEQLQSSKSAGPTVAVAHRSRAGAQTLRGANATSAVLDAARPSAGVRRTQLSASTSSNSSVEQGRPVRGVADLSGRVTGPAASSTERRGDAPTTVRLDQIGVPTRAPATSLATATRSQTVPRRPFGGGPAAPQATATFTASRPRMAITRPTTVGPSAQAGLSKTASLASTAPGVPSGSRKAPRAALAVRQTASAPTLAAPATLPSPVKPRRPAGTVAESDSATIFAPPLIAARARSAGVRDAAATHVNAPPPPTPSILSALPRTVSRSPLPPPCPASPTRLISSQSHASPLRSPRRVPVSQQMQPGPVAASASASILVAPAQAVVAAAPAVFGNSTRTVPPRMTRTTRRTAQADVPAPLTGPAVLSVGGRPVRAAAINATYSATTAPGPPPGGRMARKISRRQQPADAEDASSAEAEAVVAAESKSTASSDTADNTEALPSVTPRPLPIFRPAPVLTQVELNRLTQRNTKKNQQTFNQLKLETVFLDYDRPPSPTSKIRKASSLANAASKEGREARAAKRRNALRASVDGSELEALSLELSDEDVDAEPMEHYRAPGDEEPYSTPARTTAVHKSAGGSKGAGSKKRTSADAALDRDKDGKTARRVRWDRSLVYEGPREGYAKPRDASILIIKSSEFDSWGNPTAPPRDLGKAVPVTIRMRVFKNDEQ